MYSRKRLWRQKYPWLFVVYLVLFAVLLSVAKLNPQNYEMNIDLLTGAIFASFVSLYVAYIYGVRPDELEHHFK